MKNSMLMTLLVVVIHFCTLQIKAQDPAKFIDSLTFILQTNIEEIGINKLVKYDKVRDGKPFYTERTISKKDLLNSVFIRNDSLIIKYKEEHIDWVYYDGKKYKNLNDPPGCLSAALIDLKLSIWEATNGTYAGYYNNIKIEPISKQYNLSEFPYRFFCLKGDCYSNIWTNKDAKELDSEHSFISFYNLCVLNIYNKKLDSFKIKAKYQENRSVLSEEQRKFIVQANAANENKIYEKALRLYEQAMQINEFNYPSAYYNMALIAAQLENYPYAIFSMSKYIILSPNAEDARAAQDKIYEWELNIK